MKRFIFPFAVVLAAVHFALGFSTIRALSAAYDEPVHLTAGYVYWKTGAFAYNGLHHPALGEMIAAAPLLVLNPRLPLFHPSWRLGTWTPQNQYRFASAFLYRGDVSWDRLLHGSRLGAFSLSFLLAALLAIAAHAIGGPVAAVAVLPLWAFSPTVLAHGTLVGTDMPFAVFFFGFFMALHLWRSRRGAVAAGLMLGACLASKFFSLAILPAGAALAVWSATRAPGKRPRDRWFGAAYAGLMLASAAVVLLIVYRGDLGVWWAGLSGIVSRAQTGRSAFFLGSHGTDGWLLYFPVAFLMKTPVPVLILFGIGVVQIERRRAALPSVFWIPPAVFFGMACLSRVQIGHRHILAVYPFVFLVAALGVGSLASRRRWAVAPLYAWLVLSVVAVHPYQLSYFNEAVGGPARGYRYFTDSNVDWGQGLKSLAAILGEEDRKNGIYLSYFGTSDPNAHGIRWISVGTDPLAGHRDSRAERGLAPTKFAISATHYQATYFADKSIFDWLKSEDPVAVAAHSLFLYDFAGKPALLARLRRLAGIET